MRVLKIATTRPKYTTHISLTIIVQQIVRLCLVIALAGTLSAKAYAQSDFITIGSGYHLGFYFKAGKIICAQVNAERTTYGMRCAIEAMRGSRANAAALRAGEIDFGMMQSNWQYHAYRGTSLFAEKGAYKELRAVFTLYPENLTIITRPDTGIKTLNDLKRRKISMSVSGRHMWDLMMVALGWPGSEKPIIEKVKPYDSLARLCDGRTDAVIYFTRYPHPLPRKASEICNTRLAAVGDKTVETLIDKIPYFTRTKIPGGYKGWEPDTVTIGSTVTLVSASDIPNDTVYNFVKFFFENIESLRSSHKVLGNLDPKRMVTDTINAPIHAGAMRYYREIGLIE